VWHVGGLGYFRHRPKATFATLDHGVRRRLRSLLRHRQGLRGRGRGADPQRWPQACFAEQGWFSLATAQAAACPSSRR